MTDSPAPADPQEPPRPALQQLAEENSPGLLSEFAWFLMHNKKWWLTPIIVVLLLVGLLILASGTALAPFIYPLF